MPALFNFNGPTSRGPLKLKNRSTNWWRMLPTRPSSQLFLKPALFLITSKISPPFQLGWGEWGLFTLVMRYQTTLPLPVTALPT
eukprot:8531790-Ditylum_brightwellii.AAC.1